MAEEIAAKEEVKIETKEEVKEGIKEEVDDIDAKLERLYANLNKPEDRAAIADDRIDTRIDTRSTERVINTMDDYKKWKEEEPDAAEAWMMRTTTEAAIRTEKAKDKFRIDSENWTKNERAVLSRHSNAIKDDGTIDRSDPWMKEYIQIGKENPELLRIPNGPLLAEAMAEKKVNVSNKGTDFEAGAKAEVERQTAAIHANTNSSTKVRPKAGVIALTPDEQRMADRYRMSPEDWKKYSSQKTINKIDQNVKQS